jgi:DNA-binding MurR/RpiR family transcriptional regulator
MSTGGLSNLRGKYDSLSNSEKKVADYIINHNGIIHSLTLADIANHSKVSEATVVRFFRSLGYERLFDLKVDLLQSLESSTKYIHSEIKPEDSQEAIVTKLFLGSMQALGDTLAIMDFQKFEKIILLLQKAHNILIIGIGSSWWVCQELNQRLLRLGLHSQAQVDCYTQLAQAALLTDNDLLFVVSQTGEPESLIRIVNEAKNNNCPIITITGNENSPIGQLSDIVLLSISNEMPFESLSSRVAQHIIVQSIYISLAYQKIDISSNNEKRILQAAMWHKFRKNGG